ncbi:unnamed protein product [Anisakis simplex]|uniref:Uncharacterized protein n=1 Tax=Anisakis simplex TaxID=6269 RepID=A0A3P6RST2_ANISI|nr:unnamed protein product [Anisakis simplex]
MERNNDNLPLPSKHLTQLSKPSSRRKCKAKQLNSSSKLVTLVILGVEQLIKNCIYHPISLSFLMFFIPLNPTTVLRSPSFQCET